MTLFWHQLKGHVVQTRRVSVPARDMFSKGLLHTCSCGKVWAQ